MTCEDFIPARRGPQSGGDADRIGAGTSGRFEQTRHASLRVRRPKKTTILAGAS
jgi:hypothetical protein